MYIVLLTNFQLEFIEGVSIDLIQLLHDVVGELCHGADGHGGTSRVFLLISVCESTSSHVSATYRLDLLDTTILWSLQ